MWLQSYRSRLFFYSIILMLFLATTLLYSYYYVKNVIHSEADIHMIRMVQLLTSHLESERSELQRYASVVGKDLRLKEYMFVVAKIGSDSGPLSDLYDRIFGWLPIDRKIIMSDDHRVFVGKKHIDLAKILAGRRDKKHRKVFYFKGGHGFEVVATAPIEYRDELLGYVAVTRFIDQKWLDHQKDITGGQFFLKSENKVIVSTMPGHEGGTFNSGNGSTTIGGDIYRTSQIDLPGNSDSTINLWFGISEAALNQRLVQHLNLVLTLVVVGILAIFFLGSAIIRNFNRPLLQLIGLTQKVADGGLPRLEKYKVKNEIQELSNQFSDMLKSLREKQAEVDRTQKELERIAITDALTGLYNRRHLQEVFPKIYAQAQRDKRGVFAFLLDIDHFKKINDTYGHLAGDRCLEKFSEQLVEITRKNDFLFRMGGEEFLVLTTGQKASDMIAIAEKIRTIVEQTPIKYEGNVISMTTSCGVSCTKASEDPPDRVLHHMLTLADAALYEAKNGGRNKVCFSKACKNDYT